MNHLHRELAPVSDLAWEQIEQEARYMLTMALASRKLTDVRGPLGWETSAVSLGRVKATQSQVVPGVGARIRQVRPLVELRVPFQVARAELDGIDRGAEGPDLEAVSDAARKAALAEDAFVFHGCGDIGSPGMVTGADDHVMMGKEFDD